MSNWQEYFEKTRNIKPRPYLVKALQYVQEKGKALDLGSGALNDAAYLIGQGFGHVTAVDSTAADPSIVASFPGEKLTYAQSTFEDFSFPAETYDLINAQYSLPFNPSQSFDRVFTSAIASLKHGGVFTGQLFGERDSWNVPEKNMTFHSKEAAERLLSGLEIIAFDEEEKDATTALGHMKHWHVFNIIGRKR